MPLLLVILKQYYQYVKKVEIGVEVDKNKSNSEKKQRMVVVESIEISKKFKKR